MGTPLKFVTWNAVASRPRKNRPIPRVSARSAKIGPNDALRSSSDQMRPPDIAVGGRLPTTAAMPFLEGEDERVVSRDPFAQEVPAVLRIENPGLLEVRIEAQGHAALPEHEQFRHEVRERLCRGRPAGRRPQRHHGHEPRDGSCVHHASHRVSAPVALKVRAPVGRGKMTR